VTGVATEREECLSCGTQLDRADRGGLCITCAGNEEAAAAGGPGDLGGEAADWLPVSSACPACGVRGVVRVREVMRVTGPAYLAGARVKYSARPGWEFRCTACGAAGPAEPKSPGTRPLAPGCER
jgi:hypothetical protein